MAVNRMNREEFFAQSAKLDAEQLRKALWNVYWRSAAPVRTRIEAELAPEIPRPRRAVPAGPPDPQGVLAEVQRFTALARAGSYLAGDRKVSPKERSNWRFTLRRLAKDAVAALAAADPRPAEQAVAELVELAEYASSYQTFRSDDPVEAARFVVSDAVEQLWKTVLRRVGSTALAHEAAPQLLRWEREFGWTIRGDGTVAEKERQLADVLAGLLRGPDAWVACADAYLAALDDAVDTDARRNPFLVSSHSTDYRRSRRAADLERWHELLLERLPDYDAADRLDRLCGHPALTGGHALLLRARWAHARGETDTARGLVTEGLRKLPGLHTLHSFAEQIGAPVPRRAR